MGITKIVTEQSQTVTTYQCDQCAFNTRSEREATAHNITHVQFESKRCGANIWFKIDSAAAFKIFREQSVRAEYAHRAYGIYDAATQWYMRKATEVPCSRTTGTDTIVEITSALEYGASLYETHREALEEIARLADVGYTPPQPEPEETP